MPNMAPIQHTGSIASDEATAGSPIEETSMSKRRLDIAPPVPLLPIKRTAPLLRHLGSGPQRETIVFPFGNVLLHHPITESDILQSDFSWQELNTMDKYVSDKVAMWENELAVEPSREDVDMHVARHASRYSFQQTWYEYMPEEARETASASSLNESSKSLFKHFRYLSLASGPSQPGRALLSNPLAGNASTAGQIRFSNNEVPPSITVGYFPISSHEAAPADSILKETVLTTHPCINLNIKHPLRDYEIETSLLPALRDIFVTSTSDGERDIQTLAILSQLHTSLERRCVAAEINRTRLQDRVNRGFTNAFEDIKSNPTGPLACQASKAQELSRETTLHYLTQAHTTLHRQVTRREILARDSMLAEYKRRWRSADAGGWGRRFFGLPGPEGGAEQEGMILSVKNEVEEGAGAVELGVNLGVLGAEEAWRILHPVSEMEEHDEVEYTEM